MRRGRRGRRKRRRGRGWDGGNPTERVCGGRLRFINVSWELQVDPSSSVSIGVGEIRWSGHKSSPVGPIAPFRLSKTGSQFPVPSSQFPFLLLLLLLLWFYISVYSWNIYLRRHGRFAVVGPAANPKSKMPIKSESVPRVRRRRRGRRRGKEEEEEEEEEIANGNIRSSFLRPIISDPPVTDARGR